MGDQRGDASHDIFFENALPVIDGPAFADYVEKVLVPELTPGTVVILDNLATHKNATAAKAMRDAGCWFLFLPPYSPDLNPIEMTFSKLKAHLGRIGARQFNGMFDAIPEVCNPDPPQEGWNTFKAPGYIPS
ncbi:transposase [Aestuariivita sp.]|uniref:transposase n=1 Tax=Aestuariivita sp. TaxID=1872407 RepID=UPI0021709B02|nr:transposase [Aestuariivita sp.]MCE8009905.1 transposase [Aestuariivita sp.]